MNPFEMAFQAGWEDLVRRYDPMLRGQVRRTLKRAGFAPEAEPVDDWVQETYCRLLHGGPPRLSRLRSLAEGQVINYLARTASRVVLDEKRSRSSVKRGGQYRILTGGRHAEIADRMADPRATPEQEAIRRELRRLLLARCQALVDSRICARRRRRYFSILRRVYLEGWTSVEVVHAERGRLAPTTIHALLHRVRRRLTAEARNGAWRERYHGRP